MQEGPFSAVGGRREIPQYMTTIDRRTGGEGDVTFGTHTPEERFFSVEETRDETNPERATYRVVEMHDRWDRDKDEWLVSWPGSPDLSAFEIQSTAERLLTALKLFPRRAT